MLMENKISISNNLTSRMEDFEWNVVNEGQLLDAMVGHKPVGVNKYFQMAFICDKFTDNLHKDINSDKIWAHLETMYNLEALDECESIPFPNTEREFNLPDSEYASLIGKKEDKKVQTPKSNQELSKSLKDFKKEDNKTPVRLQKDQRDRDGKDNRTPKKDMKKEPEKSKVPVKGRTSISAGKDDNKTPKSKSEDTPKLTKRPTRGSMKPNDDSGSSGKSSPITVAPTAKRRRI
ncbi:unnamed protein product [Phaedon cochleariae]|uniref:MRG-binding protein n=1 Tax=Phaedon cochleariae TaxID=80249 RepID=A0A9P0DG66_PHACE|nr:unnamed protein product [Phaedon cochleariae]